MQYINGMTVLDSSGEKAGEVERVVLDPHSGEVTYIIVRRGFLFPEDKVIPVEMVERTNDEELRLTITAEEASEQPDFVELNYAELDDNEMGRLNYHTGASAAGLARPYYYYPFAGTAGPFGWGTRPSPAGPYTYPYKVTEDVNIPDDAIALKEGAKVTGRDGKHVGDVEKIITAGENDMVTHMVITKGFLSKEKKLIPSNWINDVQEDHVELTVNSEFIERLRDYEE